jgi:signal transduction histidine kinase
VLAVLALLGGVVQLRRRAQQRLERTRRRIADDLHDDLGSKISSVALMIDVAGRDADPRHQPLLREASTTAREVARDLRDAIWLVDTGRDTLGAFLKHTRTVAARISPTRPVAIDASGPLHVPLSMEQRRHLLLFVKEALHNAVRHAEATEIRVACRLDDGRLRLSVEDDGVGFSPDTTCGRGLRTMPHRADALGGTFTLDTTPGHGTRATIAFDLY